MAAEDLEWERSKISNQDLNMMKKLGLMKKEDAIRFPSEESYPNPPMEYRNHPTMASLPPLPEDGEVEEQAIVAEDNQGSSLHESEVAGSHKSAASHEKEVESEASESTQSLPPAVSPKNKRKRDDAETSGTSKPEEAVPSHPKSAYDPYLGTLISSDEEEEVPAADVAARTSTSHTLVASETPVEGEETSPPRQNVDTATPPSPRAPLSKRARTEIIPEPTLQLSSSSNPLLEDPLIKDLLRIGTQFVGYREYASKAEEKLAETNERANTLAQQLEQSEKARKKAESDAVGARAEADKAKADAAGVEDLRKRLHDAETSLSEHITAQSAREEAILKRLRTQSRRFVEELKELRVQLQSVKKQSLILMEQSRESSQREKIALQQAQDAMTEKDAAVAEAAAATSRENSMLQLLIDASLDMAGAFLDTATENERVEARSNVLLRLAREHGSTFWGTPDRTRQIVRFQDRALQDFVSSFIECVDIIF
ncbi:hypothetical protein QYE76_012420 [Lolium multiflorum]|uniref:Uncharacterized protein n=1 Tax=Lolium multiflorum TaxID=4521 RepID=A0AAD8U0L8_LOLMU|nr:hypothetical protein QYE76_012420 [Lolium multiflorum]